MAKYNLGEVKHETMLARGLHHKLYVEGLSDFTVLS